MNLFLLTGWICYAEKTLGSYILPYISSVKSPQQVIGAAIKHHMVEKLGLKWVICPSSRSKYVIFRSLIRHEKLVLPLVRNWAPFLLHKVLSCRSIRSCKYISWKIGIYNFLVTSSKYLERHLRFLKLYCDQVFVTLGFFWYSQCNISICWIGWLFQIKTTLIMNYHFVIFLFAIILECIV